jgi:DNA mismatch repair protein MutL
MPKINLLDKQVSELIAAGEVIERPASIVKELLENSIDAGATAVTVEIKNGGMKYIRITDNGCGISREDVPLAFLRHATSKIFSEQDLNSIDTLGFRGEALASICAVSKVELLTKQHQDAFGTRYLIEGGDEASIEEAGCPDGTTIIIRDLFYNVPARLKFMKKDVAEANAVASIIDKVALSNPKVSIKFIRENKTEMHSPGDANLLSAIYAVLGKDFARSMMAVNYDYNGIKVYGHASIPMMSRANRSMQHFFVNGRYVKTRTCSVAIEEAYKNSIMIGKFPACVLNIDVPATDVDVNVHPAKTEVRFVNERAVFDSVYFAIKSALAQRDALSTVPEIEYDTSNARKNVFEEQTGEQATLKTDSWHESNQKTDNGAFSRIITEKNQTDDENIRFRAVADPPHIGYAANSQPHKNEEIVFKYINQDAIKTSETLNIAEKQDESTRSQEIVKKLGQIKIIGELFKTYILAEIDNSFVMIDKHAAHERIIFEKIKSGDLTMDKQVLLSPITVSLSKEEYTVLMENLELLDKVGFTAESFGANTVVIREVPVILDRFDANQIFNEIICNIKNLKKDITPHILEEIYHSISCKAAIKANHNNDLLELIALVEQVYNNKNIRYCPHGRPVVIVQTKNDVEKKFGRQ